MEGDLSLLITLDYIITLIYGSHSTIRGGSSSLSPRRPVSTSASRYKELEITHTFLRILAGIGTEASVNSRV